MWSLEGQKITIRHEGRFITGFVELSRVANQGVIQHLLALIHTDEPEYIVFYDDQIIP
jgi:hypothetical protein